MDVHQIEKRKGEALYIVDLLTEQEASYFFGKPTDREWAFEKALEIAEGRIDELKKDYPRATFVSHRGRKEKEDSKFVADAFLTTEEAQKILLEYGLNICKIKDSDDYERV